MCDVPCAGLWVCAINRNIYDVPCLILWVCAINRSMYDVPCRSSWVCALNRSMYDVPCPSLWVSNRSDYTTDKHWLHRWLQIQLPYDHCPSDVQYTHDRWKLHKIIHIKNTTENTRYPRPQCNYKNYPLHHHLFIYCNILILPGYDSRMLQELSLLRRMEE
jgi:hypothetical protein